MNVADDNLTPDFLTSEGKLGGLIRDFNWASTPLGPIKTWPQSLKTTVSLLVNSSHPMWIGWGPDITFLYNDAYIEILGIEKHPWALGRPAREVWEEIWDYCGPLCDLVFNEAKSTSGSDVELFMKRGDFLEETFFSFSYSPIFDETGKVGGLFCPNFETTDKILSARRNRTLSELAAKSLLEKTTAAACATAAETISKNQKDIPFSVFYLLDAYGQNAELAQRTGLEKAAYSIFPDSIDITQEEAALAHPILTEVLKTGKPVIAHINADGLLPVGLAGQPVTDAIALPLTLSGSKPLGIVIFGINPTRRPDDDYLTFFEMVASQISTAVQNASAQENERRRLKELAEIDKSKTAFFSNISHEFRTPLTLMLGPLEELLESQNLPQQERGVIETTHRNAMRLLKLVNTLLDFSLMESGRLKARFVPVDIKAYTENLAGNFRSVIEKAGLDFEVEADTITEPIFIDRQMWEKIVFNLLSNAFKFTLDGKIKLSLLQDGSNVLLQVQDTGLGIAAAELPNMFTRFHRIQGAAGRSFEGSGIGLSMIKEFVLQHGGQISVESTKGSGSTFTVALPAGKAHLPPEQIFEEDIETADIQSGYFIKEAATLISNERETDEVMHEAIPKSAETILIVDDNADMRRHLKSIIAKQYNVLVAENGMQALDIIQHTKVSLVLSDIMMPVMDGIQLLKEIKAYPDTATIPVVLLTARAGEESRIEGYETGADDYLVKPFSSKELEARIRSQIRIAQTRDHIRTELNNLFMQAPMAICILRGKDFVVEMANDNIMKLWGKEPWQMLNKPLLEGLPEAEAQGFDKLLEQVYNTGKEYIDEECLFYNVNADGAEERMYIKFIYQPFHEEDGTISGIIVLAHDVTQQVKARKKIEDSESKFRNLIHQAPMGIIILKGHDLVFDIANDAYLKIRGKRRIQLLGKKMGDALPEIKGTDVERRLREVMETGKSKTYIDTPAEIVIDGHPETRYFNSVYQPLFEDDTVTGVICVVNEVTEQYLAKKVKEKNEQDLMLILEAMPHIAYRANPDGQVTYFNNKYFTYTGLSHDDALKMDWDKVVHPDMIAESYHSWMKSIQTGEEHSQTLLLKRGHDGTYRWHLSRAVALRDETGEISQWVGTLTDVHEQKIFAEKLEAMVTDRTEKLNRSNDLLEQKNVELEQSNKELESFNYIASHDLQEPLRKIRTFINMINDGGRPEKNDFYLSKIDSSAERMSQLINAVLSYSRLSSATDQHEMTDLNTILRQVLNDFELVIEEKRVTVQSDTLPVINAIPQQMNQLFSNLIGNSLKYSTEKPEITIRYREITGDKIVDFDGDDTTQKYAELRFIDNGIGFEKQYSGQIFKLFQRLHGRSEYSGTGIGLSICKKIVEQHDGYISAESVPGEGATFTIQLPL